jgi:hypothetical protein
MHQYFIGPERAIGLIRNPNANDRTDMQKLYVGLVRSYFFRFVSGIEMNIIQWTSQGVLHVCVIDVREDD